MGGGNGDSKGKGGGGAAPRARGRWGLGGLLASAALLAAIVLGALVFAVRTDWARSMVTDWLKKELGTDVSVERTRIGLPYVLVLDNLRSVSTGDKAPGFAAEEVRIGLGCFEPRWRVSIYHGTLRLVRGAEGSWAPAAFARLGGLPGSNIAEVSRLTEGFRDRVRLRVRDSEVRWLDEARAENAVASGVAFEVQPLDVSDRRMYFYRLAVYSVLQPNGKRIHEVERVWLASHARSYIEVEKSGPLTAEEVGGFWMFTAPPEATEKEKK